MILASICQEAFISMWAALILTQHNVVGQATHGRSCCDCAVAWCSSAIVPVFFAMCIERLHIPQIVTLLICLIFLSRLTASDRWVKERRIQTSTPVIHTAKLTASFHFLQEAQPRKRQYADSIESLVRNNIQKMKIDMANEVIDAGRFDMQTSMEERKQTLEALLQVQGVHCCLSLYLLSLQ